MTSYESSRNFRLWKYSPSHSTLLLRSNKSEEIIDEQESTIDIDFTDVKYVELPISLTGVRLQEAVEVPAKIREIKQDGKVFELISGNRVFYVVAWRCIVGRGEMDYDETIYSSRDYKYDEIIVQF